MRDTSDGTSEWRGTGAALCKKQNIMEEEAPKFVLLQKKIVEEFIGKHENIAREQRTTET